MYSHTRTRLTVRGDNALNTSVPHFCPFFIEKIERTVQIEASTVEIEERGVKLRLTVVDTPGYGDAINSQDWYVCAP